MKAIIENKLYDTEKSEKIFDYLRNEPQPVFWSNTITMHCWRNTDIYKTRKNSYFLHIHTGDKEGKFMDLKERIELITEKEVKKIILNLDVDKYIKMYGNVEEG